MPGGRKAKKVKHDHNVSLSDCKNQSKAFPLQSDSTPHPTPPRSEAPSPELSDFEDESETNNKYELLNHFNSLKADFEQEDVVDWSDEEEEDNGDMDELMEWCKEENL